MNLRFEVITSPNVINLRVIECGKYSVFPGRDKAFIEPINK